MARIGIACGGTGGHLYPGLAVAEILSGMGHEVRLYISTKEIDRKVLSGYSQFSNVALPTIGWPGVGPRVFNFCNKFLEAYRISVREIRNERLSAVLGMGGFTSAPLILSASRRRIPTLLHESNAIPGKVTRWLSGKVDRVLLGFDECRNHFSGVRTKTTGTPVRSSLRRMDRRSCAGFWELDPEKFTIAVIGGSQGAQGLNRMVIQAMPDWAGLKQTVQFIHLAGDKESELLTANYRRNGLSAAVRPFCAEMEYLYSMADLLVARSGAASLTEISCFGLPSILVPYPHAAEDHQTCNAQIFVSAGAARLVSEGKGAEQRLAETIRLLAADGAMRAGMASCALSLNTADAARRVAEEVQDVL